MKLLNDRFGIQTRGGCSCAGTYGHFLLHVDQQQSREMIDKIDQGCDIERPGWIRMSIHPTTTDQEVEYICDSIRSLAANFEKWSEDYDYNPHTGEFTHKTFTPAEHKLVKDWFGDLL